MPLSRLCQRPLLISLVVFVPLAIYLLLIVGGAGSAIPRERSAWARSWNLTLRNHRELLDDRFTLALSTFHKPKELQHTLDILLGNKIPSLLEIVVIWNDRDEEMPTGYVNPHGVEVRYRKPPRDSLNEKLWNAVLPYPRRSSL
ncbi:glycosyltransferase family 64 protein [Cordyceps fumosorosea ARSEF 2679]|uniref:Glycosyltransferase family 64 protein n=1 Tax=Cordyceps fumosorosea (strain ARSEF 2679) TaxID=1081104 RepID=A0A168CJV2_CORFA|nr:glycosyltransferase family 64 protein [Cordyceps fumosorosea ARSEF 2679]OAA71466.1 glycosyltransferase family 64 protein [Cordyceps fumosorosea ARSEF 2679]